jgi:Sigma-70, region 4
MFLVRDVLGWSAADTASLLDTSVASINSMLQRARATLQRSRPSNRVDWVAAVDSIEHERMLLQRFMLACERGDAAAIVDMLSEDARWTMPPFAWWFDGRAAVGASLHEGLGPGKRGDFRMVALFESFGLPQTWSA